MNVIDDLAIGLFFSQHLHIAPASLGAFVEVPDFAGDYERLRNFITPESTIFYRNRSENRTIDCIQMALIVNILEDM